MNEIEEIKEIIKSGNINKIANVIANVIRDENNFEQLYKVVCTEFEYLPLEFTGLDEESVNKDPVGAFNTIGMDVDGSKGFGTNYTPKTLIDIYKKCWNNNLDVEKKECSRITKYEYFDVNWKKDWGNVSGDVIFSFPKKTQLDEINKMGIECRCIKLLARLCYTLGNFIPVPKLGRGKLSTDM